MALAMSIDTLDYDGLVAEAQRRIIARSRGQWTLHAPVDPGITLIELFAWLLDQRSYWAAQTGGDFARSIMRLLGERTQPARAAVAPITSRDHLAAGQQLRFSHPSSQLVFTVDEELAPTPSLASSPLAVRVDGTDVGADLRAKRPFELLHAGTPGTRAELDVSFEAPVTSDRAMSIAIIVDTDDQIPPQWSPDAVDAPPPAALTFTYRAAGSIWKPLTVRDGTGGLRRSGIVRFALPADAAPTTAPQRYTYTVAVTAAEATFTASPLVVQLHLDATTARHAVERAISDVPRLLPLPGRVIELPTPPLEDSVKLSIVEADAQKHEWNAVDDFTTAKPGDRVFLVDRTYSCLRFGDGLNGRLPYPDAATAKPITGSYREGGGLKGNVGIGSWVGVVASGGVEAISIAPALGGRDSESIDDARLRIADQFHIRTRAATAEDYAVIATTTPGVWIRRAHAAIGFDPAEPCLPAPGVVTVFVVPGVAERTPTNTRVPAPEADPGALAAVARRFATKRLLGTQVIVQPARYRDVEIRVDIAGDPWDAADTRARAGAAIREYLDPLFGGAERTGWEFGAPVRPSDLMRVVQDTIDEDGEVSVVGITLPRAKQTNCADAGSVPEPEIVCGDAKLAPYELPRATKVRIRIVPSERVP